MEVLVDSRDVGEVPCDLLGIWCFSDVRPLRGAAGTLDWKLDGSLSRLVRGGCITGDWGEKVLLWPAEGIDAGGILLVGLGEQGLFDTERIRQAARLMMEAASRLRVQGLCLSLPGEGLEGFDAVKVAEHFLEGLVQIYPDTGLTPWIVCAPQVQDEVFLGLQQTKVNLKGRFAVEIRQVQP